MRLGVNTRWYSGRHDEAYPGNKDRGSGCATALILERPWHEDDE